MEPSSVKTIIPLKLKSIIGIRPVKNQFLIRIKKNLRINHPDHNAPLFSKIKAFYFIQGLNKVLFQSCMGCHNQGDVIVQTPVFLDDGSDAHLVVPEQGELGPFLALLAGTLAGPA